MDVADEEDFAKLISGLYDGASVWTGFVGFHVEDDEARTIAKPLVRILRRNPELIAVVTKVADPVALLLATATVTLPRIAAYMTWKQMMSAAQTQSQQGFPPTPGPATSVTSEQREAQQAADHFFKTQFQQE